MNREQKGLIINLMREKFLDNHASFLVGYKGLTVLQMQKLRKQLRERGGQFKVAKNRLVKRAIDQVEGVDQLSSYLKNQIGVVFAEEPSAIAKVLYDFSKEHDGLKLIVGQLQSKIFDQQGVIRIAGLPSKQVLMAQLLRTIQSPLTSFNTLMHVMILKFIWALKMHADQKEKNNNL